KCQKRLPDAEAGVCDGLEVVASNGKKSPLLRIPDGVKIYKIEEFGGVPVYFQQDGAPTHTTKIVQDWCAANFYHFWSKELWPLSSPDCNPLDLA
ncbi:Putative transposable element, partial [Caligus rogercresseyi]